MFSLAYTRSLEWLRTCGVLLALPALTSACSVVNTDHCGNQDGHATCLQRDANTPYCSICVADNNGCLAVDPGDACQAQTAPATGVDPTTSTSPSTTVVPTTDTTAVDPPTGTTTQDPTTTGDTTQTSEPVDTSTSTTGTSTGDTSTGDTSTTGPGTDTDSSTGGATMSSSGSESGTGGPMCGNNEVEGDEVCDGTDVNGFKCVTLLPNKWGGGMLTCNDCLSYNDTQCCIGLNQKCNLLEPAEACCGGLTCKLDNLLETRCLN